MISESQKSWLRGFLKGCLIGLAIVAVPVAVVAAVCFPPVGWWDRLESDVNTAINNWVNFKTMGVAALFSVMRLISERKKPQHRTPKHGHNVTNAPRTQLETPLAMAQHPPHASATLSKQPEIQEILRYVAGHLREYLGAGVCVFALLLAASTKMDRLANFADIPFLAVSLKLPYFYYVLLRLLVCAVSASLALQSSKRNSGFWTWAFAANAVLFNPVIPIRMDKVNWAFVNLIDALFFATWISISARGSLMKQKASNKTHCIGI